MLRDHGSADEATVEQLLEIEELSCVRDGRALFSGLNVRLATGDCMSLIGPNGSGKSTLLRCVAGLFPDFEGTIRAAELSYLGHRPGVSLGLTAEQNLSWYRGLAGANLAIDAVLTRVGLAGYGVVSCQRLSAGQQRRVALARLLLGRGRLWLLDEPFTALDDAGQDLVRELIVEHLAAGGAALCATHQPLGVPGAGTLDLSSLD
jgi:heme exporter protein A